MMDVSIEKFSFYVNVLIDLSFINLANTMSDEACSHWKAVIILRMED